MQEVGLREVKKVPTLRGRTIINLFFESSTRTRTSFEIAGKRLSADVINFSAESSSLTKSEIILDTARTLDAMDPDAVIVRHKVAGVPKRIADVLEAPVMNAGDGAHEHPDPGAARPLHRPPGEGTDRRPHGHDRRRHPALAGGALQHLRLPQARSRGAGRRPRRRMLPAEIETLGVKAFTSLREALDGRGRRDGAADPERAAPGRLRARAFASTRRPSASIARSSASPRKTPS